jgi:hypothetical protein
MWIASQPGEGAKFQNESANAGGAKINLEELAD